MQDEESWETARVHEYELRDMSCPYRTCEHLKQLPTRSRGFRVAWSDPNIFQYSSYHFTLRTVFIDKSGVIKWIDKQIDPPTHGADVIARIDAEDSKEASRDVTNNGVLALGR